VVLIRRRAAAEPTSFTPSIWSKTLCVAGCRGPRRHCPAQVGGADCSGHGPFLTLAKDSGEFGYQYGLRSTQ
jgi:hypothetical protein